MACKVRGTIREISTVDLSKKAGVPNLYTEILLEVEEVIREDKRRAIGPDVVFFRQGQLDLKTGAHVELEVESLDWKRLRIVHFRAL